MVKHPTHMLLYLTTFYEFKIIDTKTTKKQLLNINCINKLSSFNLLCIIILKCPNVFLSTNLNIYIL